MRATVIRAWEALRAGRTPCDVAAQLAGAFAIGGAMWACACAVMLLEPLP